MSRRPGGYTSRIRFARAGDFVYETPGEAHTPGRLRASHTMKVFSLVNGPLIWLHESGAQNGYFDMHQYLVPS